MIKSFKDKETSKIYQRELSRKFPIDVQSTALRRLVYLNAAKSLNDIGKIPGHRLKSLKGDREGQHNIRINDQYRICFVWQDGNAYDVEVTDYH